MKVFTGTVTVYVQVYDGTTVDEVRRHKMDRSLERSVEEVRVMMTDHGHVEVSSTPMLEIGADEVPVWVDKAFDELEDLQLDP